MKTFGLELKRRYCRSHTGTALANTLNCAVFCPRCGFWEMVVCYSGFARHPRIFGRTFPGPCVVAETETEARARPRAPKCIGIPGAAQCVSDELPCGQDERRERVYAARALAPCRFVELFGGQKNRRAHSCVGSFRLLRMYAPMMWRVRGYGWRCPRVCLLDGGDVGTACHAAVAGGRKR